MTADEARELFSEAFEGELSPERKAAFDEAVANDPALHAEYDDFVDTFRTMGRLAEAEEAQPAPDLLHGVQDRLRKRSRGRYYRDRFSERAGPGWVMPLLFAMVGLLLVALAWYLLQMSMVVFEEPAEAPASERSTSD
jgi:anti-sigma factor RsiW